MSKEDNDKRAALAAIAEAQREAARLRAEREAEEQAQRDDAVRRLLQGPRLG